MCVVGVEGWLRRRPHEGRRGKGRGWGKGKRKGKGEVSGLVACGAVYFVQLDRGSRRASAYVTTRAGYVTTTAYDSPGYVTTGSFRVVQWSRSRDLSACGRALAPRPLNCGPQVMT